ncbi:hypothetical protein SDC9_46817 [bioreactor metagenome]|uniref:Uncharacterized protein n=1 Tax=bioreactor metagenome TaxID=1076179 RepID=A0A644W9X2_9ZZZZ
MKCEGCPYDDPKERQHRFKMLYTPENPDWQPEYLWCDKVGGEHWQFGYCEENNNTSLIKKKAYKRRPPDRALRRHYGLAKEKRLRKIIKFGGYAPHRGYVDYDFVDGIWRPAGTHIKYPARSNTQKWIKQMTSKKVRKINDVPHYNGYRRYIDY